MTPHQADSLKFGGPVGLAVMATLLAGCGDPNSEELGLIRSFSLVSVSITDHYDTPTTHARRAILTYLSPLDGYYKIVTIGTGGGPWGGEGKTLTEMAVVAPPLPGPSPDPNDPTTVDAAVASLAALTATPTAGTRVNYWLSATSGSPVWTVTTNDDTNGTSIRKFLDVATGTVTGLSSTPPTPGVPAVDVPTMSALEARTHADTAIELWASDAKLYNMFTLEQDMTSFEELKLGRSDPGDEVLVPADHKPGDGRSPVWGFAYASTTQGMVRPVYVYAGYVPILGTAFVPRYTIDSYQNITISPTLIDTTTAALHQRPPLNGTTYIKYDLDVGNGGHLWWRIDYGHPYYLSVRDDNLAFDCWPDTGCDF